MHEQLTLLADRIEKYDGGSTTFQASKSLTMCPFPECFYMCSSQYAAVKHAMHAHYHTWVVCGTCLCHFAPSLTTNVSSGQSLVTLKEHILLCRSPAGLSMAEASTEEVPSARSTPVSVSASIGAPDDGANTVDGDADGVSDKGGAQWASRKWNLAAVLVGGADSSDDEEEAEQASKKWNLVAMLGGKESSRDTRPTKRSRKARK